MKEIVFVVSVSLVVVMILSLIYAIKVVFIRKSLTPLNFKILRNLSAIISASAFVAAMSSLALKNLYIFIVIALLYLFVAIMFHQIMHNIAGE